MSRQKYLFTVQQSVFPENPPNPQVNIHYSYTYSSHQLLHVNLTRISTPIANNDTIIMISYSAVTTVLFFPMITVNIFERRIHPKTSSDASSGPSCSNNNDIFLRRTFSKNSPAHTRVDTVNSGTVKGQVQG